MDKATLALLAVRLIIKALCSERVRERLDSVNELLDREDSQGGEEEGGGNGT